MDRALFLDKDGTLIENVPYNVDPDRIHLTPRAAEGLTLLCEAGFRLIVVSNQSGVAFGRFEEGALAGVERRMRELLGEAGLELAGFYYCPHHPQGSVPEYARACDCRKPEPGMILRAAEDLGIDPAASWFAGDILDDVEAGHRAGCRSVLVHRGHETEWRLGPLRYPDLLAVDLCDAARKILSADSSAGSTHAGQLHQGDY